MLKRIDLSVVVLSFNVSGFLRKCLKSIENSRVGKYNLEVIVVDNASGDNSVEMVKKEFPKVELVVNKSNLGFSKGNNIGVGYAKGRYILFLNPDTELSRDALKEALDYMETHKDVGVVSPRLELADGVLDEASHRGFPTPWNSISHFSGLRKLFPYSKIFAGYTQGWKLKDKAPHEVDSLSGAFYLVRREAGESVGWWDEDYFWYGEDLDFSYRLKQKGWKVIFLPQFTVRHYRGVSSGIVSHSKDVSTADKESKMRSAKASTEAMKIFYQKHYKDKYSPWVGWLVLTGINMMTNIRRMKHAL